MDKSKVRRIVREELDDKSWRDSMMRQVYQDNDKLIIKDIVRTELDDQINKMIDGTLKYAVMEHVNKRPDFNDILNEHKQNLKTNLQQETTLQYKDFKLKCDSYTTDHKILGKYATKDEHNAQISFQSSLNYTIGFGLLGLFGWNIYNHFSDKK